MSNIKIRAHHLLCLQGYQGYGYNERFIQHLCAVLKFIQTTPGVEMEVIAENDIICAECPQARGEYCLADIEDEWRIRRMDLKVLDKLNLKSGTIDRAERLISLVNAEFDARKDLVGICEKCRWQKKCLWFRTRS